jgi:hypothetical protein
MQSSTPTRRATIQGVLPLVVLLFFMNSAICYCISFGHDHDHGHADTEQPVPQDCECLSLAQPLQAEDVGLSAPPVLIGTLVAVPAVDPCDASRSGRLQIEVRPPGEHAPPAYRLNCALLC